MIGNYLIIALRNFTYNKLYSFLNIFGLALSFAAAILIFLFIRYELSHDQWLPSKDRIYRLYRSWSNFDGTTVWTPAPLAPALRSDIPEIQYATAFGEFGKTLFQYRENKFYVGT